MRIALLTIALSCAATARDRPPSLLSIVPEDPAPRGGPLRLRVDAPAQTSLEGIRLRCSEGELGAPMASPDGALFATLRLEPGATARWLVCVVALPDGRVDTRSAPLVVERRLRLEALPPLARVEARLGACPGSRSASRGGRSATPEGVAPLGRAAGPALRRPPSAACTSPPSLGPGHPDTLLAERRFGPVRANGRGEAELTVRLHPGMTDGTLLVAPPGEEATHRPLPVEVQPPPLVLLPERERLPADGHAAVRIWVATSPGATPAPPPVLRVEGALVPLEAEAPGLYSGSYVPSPRSRSGHVRIEARSPLGARAIGALTLDAGVEALLTLSAAGEALAADGLSTTWVELQVTDGEGEALETEPPTLRASFGRLGPLQEVAPGRFTARLVAPHPEDAAGARAVRLEAELAGASSAQLAIPLLPSPLLRMKTDVDALPADGTSRSTLLLTVRSPDGGPAPDGTRVELEGVGVSVTDSIVTSNGRGSATLTAGTRAGPATVEGRSPWGRAVVHISLLAGAPEALALRAGRRWVTCGDGAPLSLSVDALDRHGNRVEGTPVQVRFTAAGPASVEDGDVGDGDVGDGDVGDGDVGDRDVGDDGAGASSDEATTALLVRDGATGGYALHGPARCEAASLSLEARSGGVSETFELPLRDASRTRLQLAARLGTGGAGPLWIGAFELEGRLARPYASAWVPSLVAGLRLELGRGRLELSPSPAGSGSGSSSGVYVGPLWRLLARDGWRLEGGLGAEGRLGELVRADASGQRLTATNTAALGLYATVGLGIDLGPGSLSLQGRFGLPVFASSLEARSHATSLTLTAGYLLEVG